MLLTGIGAYLGYNISLKLNGPVLTSASICLTPVYAAVQAMLLIGEKLAWYHGVALLLVVVGPDAHQPGAARTARGNSAGP